MASSEKIVETLTAERGAKFSETGQAIASYGRSIVFLPRGVVPDQRIRVELRELGKDDRRGRPLYRAVPAEVEYIERWKDLGDGTASRIKIATDWLMVESEVEVLETRPLASREGLSIGQSDYQIVWGQNVAGSAVEDHRSLKIDLETEVVERDRLVWKTTGSRVDPESVVSDCLAAVEIKAAQAVGFRAWFGGKTATFSLRWTELPDWLQKAVAAGCDRCGKADRQIKVTNDRVICSSCQPYEAAEALITAELPMERRVEIAAKASRLLAGQALPQEAGEAILRATADHIASDWRRDNLLQKWAGYGWYYFCEDGVFATKLAPAALEVLRYLPQARGNGLVELVAWLVGGPKAGSSDYYLRTQVNGESGVTLTSITEDQLKQVVVADWLRGAEADRQAALAGYRRLVERLGEDDTLTKKVADLLQADAQDYGQALAEIDAAEKLLAAVERGECLVNYSRHFREMGNSGLQNAWVVQPDGAELAPDETDYRKRYSSEGNKLWRFVGPECLVLEWNGHNGSYDFSDTWEVVRLPESGLTAEQIATARSLEHHERFSGPGSGFDLTKVGSNSCQGCRENREGGRGYNHFWVPAFGAPPVPCDPDSCEPLTPEALAAKQRLERQERYQRDLEYAESQVAQNIWTRLSFRQGRHHKTGEAQWEAGNRHVKYVLDRYSSREPVEGQTYYCSLGKVLVDTPHFRLQLVCLEPPYPEDAPPLEPEPTTETSEQKGEVTPDMLAALRAKFNS